MKYTYLEVNYLVQSQWAKIVRTPDLKIGPDATCDFPTDANIGLNWIGERGWRMVSSHPINAQQLHLIFEKGQN